MNLILSSKKTNILAKQRLKTLINGTIKQINLTEEYFIGEKQKKFINNKLYFSIFIDLKFGIQLRKGCNQKIYSLIIALC